ncbi:PLP-dependent aminotransferase family protein [Paenibacillus chitinolyticus]|uniref:aminotransferase-like domain-containing protein n=1 Tax=Paenibacillus chitinolyticus TaxID=79263 RepID=UPI002DB98B82|nr:PLP-dependent aminotransferase family protein [Paenibacillus chitinolyticus]MEC0248065.1 PLP-dependent aminotransferase family protein [Paenibacillus chitinolyticus]
MNMRWKPRPYDHTPIFRQICTYFKEQILKGELSPGTRLPTERELALQLSVNRSTVSAAYEELRATGLVYSVQGSGTRVSESLWETTVQTAPNWDHYLGRRFFNPNASITDKIGEAAYIPGIVNMIKGELSPDLMPLGLLGELAAQIDYAQAYSYFSDKRGEPALRAVLSDFMKTRSGISASPESILVTSGVKHSLQLISNTLLQPGDAVALEGPSYIYAMQVFSSSGIRMFPLPVDEHGLIPDELPRLVHKHNIRMVFTNPTYQNPTGTTLSPARRAKLIDLCEQLRLPLVEDDPYGLLHLSGSRPVPPLKASPEGDKIVIYLGTLSKISTPGMRTGWIVAPPPVIAKLAETKNRMGYSSSHSGERLAQLYMTSPSSVQSLISIREALTARRNTMLSTLQSELSPYASVFGGNHNAPGGYYVWLKLNLPLEDKQLVDLAVKEGVMLWPGSIYGMKKGFFRLTYASIREHEIVEGIRRIRRAFEKAVL